MKIHVVMAAGIVLAIAVAGPTYAQGARVTQAFKKIDANGDGAITLDEWLNAGRKEKGFKMVDANGDQKITAEELQTAVAKIRNR
jgi:Ca2+-binding EF-hand superfamily protein